MSQERTNTRARHTQEPLPQTKSRLIPTLLAYALCTLFAVVAVGFLIIHSLSEITQLSVETRDLVLPTVFDRQRTAVNLERMERFGQAVYLAPEAELRHLNRVAAKVLAGDAVFETDSKVLEDVTRAYGFIETISGLRDEQDSLRLAAHNLLPRLFELRGLARQGFPNTAQTAAPGQQGFEAMLQTVLQHLDAVFATGHGVSNDPPHGVFDENLQGLILHIKDLRQGPLAGDVRVARGLEALVEIRRLRNRAHAVEDECRKLWEDTGLILTASADKLASNAAVVASQRFTHIADKARQTITGGLLGIALVMLVLAIFVILARRDVVQPILYAAQALRKMAAGEYDVTLQSVRLREMDDISRSVESQAAVMRQIAERSEALEKEIAERKHAEIELGKAKENAEAADRAKSEFLARISHEIRTPLNAILGMTEVLGETNLAPDQKNYLEIARSSSELLLDIINDILDLSKVEAGRLVLERVAFNLPELLTKALEPVEHKAKSKGLFITCNIGSDIPAQLVGDPVRLRQVLVNLLGNAVKFTFRGGVHLTVARTPENPGLLRFTVSDTGIGIPEDMQSTLFRPFVQADTSTTRKFGGTGLGLVICKRLVELMGGNITMESTPNAGSTLTFTTLLGRAGDADMPPGEQDAADASISGPPGPLRILLVEDSENNRLLIELFFKTTPHSLDFAENGRDALRLIHENHYDIMLLDIQMPEMDGYEVARAIRAEEQQTGLPRLPIIALTANAFNSDRQRCLEAGCDHFLSKPVSKADILAAVERMASQPLRNAAAV